MLIIVVTMFVVLFAFLAGGLWIGWTLAVTGTILLALQFLARTIQAALGLPLEDHRIKSAPVE